MTKYTIEQLQSLANHIREDLIKMLMAAKSGHSAGPLGMADVFTALYFGGVLNHDPKNPDWPERDKVFFVQRPHLPGFIRRFGARRIFSA